MIRRGLFNALKTVVLHPWFRLSRGLTLGTRVAVRDSDGRYLLVRHTYAPGWIFPGGGVERGETLRQAMERELAEEAGIVVTGEPRFLGVYANNRQFSGDHVAVYVVDGFRDTGKRGRLEIAEARFFAPDEMPADTSRGTLRRIAEIAGERAVSDDW